MANLVLVPTSALESRDNIAVPRQKIASAWHAYRRDGEPLGLALGRVLCEYRDDHRSRGGNGTKGQGLVQALDELNIPKSTAYFWMNRYEVSIGKKPVPCPA